MSRLKAAAVILAWWAVFVALYALETAGWPEASHWDPLDWHRFVLCFINVILIGGVIDKWKSLRSGR